MYEEKKSNEGRSIGFRFFTELPWVVRAFFNLLLIVLVAIFLFGLADKYMGIAVFGTVAAELAGFIKVIIGAVIGALTVQAKSFLDSKEHLQRDES